ncbi:MAG: hypothetical protein VYC61_01685 [Candidatus Neomarinimicrobiota bacterium]|jgi:protein-S-isoprenylcysteine O-methyltransferase Ste14|nr:hypothetical protein [Candidatus Neomarinimicrobiota bacterium]|tara:strand:+ start:1362 stop:1598 length:237 start_codon:yes stop_codon:yes gene_type:complete
MTRQKKQKIGMAIGLVISCIGIFLFFLQEIIKIVMVPSIIVQWFMVFGMLIWSLSMWIFGDNNKNQNDESIILSENEK